MGPNGKAANGEIALGLHLKQPESAKRQKRRPGKVQSPAKKTSGEKV